MSSNLHKVALCFEFTTLLTKVVIEFLDRCMSEAIKTIFTSIAKMFLNDLFEPIRKIVAPILLFDLARLASLAVFTWVHAADALWGALLGLWWISSVAFLMTSVAARKWQWNGGETSRVGS